MNALHIISSILVLIVVFDLSGVLEIWTIFGVDWDKNRKKRNYKLYYDSIALILFGGILLVSGTRYLIRRAQGEPNNASLNDVRRPDRRVLGG